MSTERTFLLGEDDITQILASMACSRFATQGGTPHVFEGRGGLADKPLAKLAAPEGIDSLAEEGGQFFGVAPAAFRTAPASETLAHWAGRIHAATGGAPETLTFCTSGSTAAPVPWPTPFALLTQEVREALTPLFVGRKRVLALVPRHHIYGFLFTVLLPKGLGVPVKELAPAPMLSNLSALKPGDLLIAFPLFWEGTAKLGATLPKDVHGTTSTGPCAPKTIKALLKKGLGRMTEIYGSTETSGLGARHDTARPYFLFPYWTHGGVGPDGTEMIARKLADGTLMPAQPMPDLLEWRDRTHFLPLRRKDKVVQVGGHNVNPETVREAICGHPLVRDCSVRLMRPEEGYRLKAFIVAKAAEPSQEERQDIRQWMKDKLPAHAVPKSVSYGTELPKTELGKLCDW